MAKERLIGVRDAEPQDASVIAGLISHLAAAMGEASPVTEAYVAKYLASPGSRALLAEVGGKAVGLLTYSVRPDLYHAATTCLIEELVVVETMRGQGVGTALLEELFSRLTALGCAEVSVTTLPDNADAIKFYKDHGLTDEAIFLEKHF
ncbi:MAG TPA: GNAT family N-acetyltransferase [bacterium]|nr:GNAT family N-acetyltransferase [bacterium]